MAIDRSKFLATRMAHLAPGFYTERDGGNWYVLTPDGEPHHERLAEDFADRDDARRLVCFLAGDPAPEGWAMKRRTKSYAELTRAGETVALVWLDGIERRFPEMLSRLEWRA